MSKIPLLFSIAVLISVLPYCSEKPKNQDSPPLTAPELDFSKDFVQRLQKNGIVVIAVKSSVTGSLFKSIPNKAVWIKTNQGVLDVVFFQKPFKNKLIISPNKLNGKDGRYKYMLTDDPTAIGQIIDANRPLYFITYDNIFIKTDRLKLNKSLKSILLGDH